MKNVSGSESVSGSKILITSKGTEEKQQIEPVIYQQGHLLLLNILLGDVPGLWRG